jgi:hypothetical protein
MALTPEERREKPLVEYGVSPLPATVPPPVLTGKGQFDESYREFESAVIDSAIKDRKHSPGEELAVGRLEQEKAMKQRNHPQYVSPEHLKLSTSTLVDMEKVDRRLEVAGLPPQFTPAQTRVANAENIEAGLEKARKGGLMVAGSSWASLPQETIKRTAEDIASQLPLGHRVSLHKNQWRGLGG